MKYIALVLAVLLMVGTANASLTVTMKGVIKGGDTNRPELVLADIDDGMMSYSLAGGVTPNENVIDNWTLVVGDEWEGRSIGLVGIVGMFDLAGVTSSDQILEARFHIRHRGPTGGEHIHVYRVTTPWLLQDAGVNEDTASAKYIIPGEDPLLWAGGADVGFSDLDYTTDDYAEFTITDPYTRHIDYDLDVTAMVRKMFDEGNNGLCLVHQNPGEFTDAPYFQCSEYNSSWDNLPDGSSPGIEMEITIPEPVTIGLMVIGGLGVLLRRKR